jgi:hypothetical protein
MAYQIFQLPPQHPLSAAGRVLPGAKAYFYLTETDTPTDTYQDAELDTEHANPVVADSGGRFPAIYLDPEVTYKVTIKDANDVLLYTIDPANPDTLQQEVSSTVAGSDGAGVIGYRRTESGSVASTVHSVLSRIVWLEDFGGAPGDGDNSAAMYAAEAALAAMGGGTIKIATPGEWRMNWVMTARNICVEGFGGHSEFDQYCIRPYNIANGPAIQIGDGSTTLYYARLKSLHISGTEGDGVDSSLSANNAAYGLRVYGAISASFEDVFVYGGRKTFSIEPSSTIPATALAFDRCKGRNDILDDIDSRLLYFRRLADPGYLTGVTFNSFKGNKPGKGYALEVHGTGCSPHFGPGSYIDCKPYWGVLFNGGNVRPAGLDVDPGDSGVVTFTTTEALTDTSRFIFGYLTQGGQRMAFLGTTTDSGTLQGATSTTAQLRAALALSDDALNGYLLVIATGTGAGQQRLITDYVGATDTCTVDAWDVTPDSSSTYTVHPTVLLTAEADWHLFRARIFRAYFGAVQYFSGSDNPYDTSMALERVAAGRMQWVGTDVEIGTAGKGLKVKGGSNAKIGSATLSGGTVTVSNSSITANSKIQLTRSTSGGTPGHLSYTKSAGVGFTINSSSGTDTSVIEYVITEELS